MSKIRTDTERLDWLLVSRSHWREVLDCGDGHKNIRGCIDAAMDAAESAQMDEAWKWFAASNCRLRFENNPHCDRNWECLCGPLGNPTVYHASDRASAVLAAYLASKEKR